MRLQFIIFSEIFQKSLTFLRVVQSFAKVKILFSVEQISGTFWSNKTHEPQLIINHAKSPFRSCGHDNSGTDYIIMNQHIGPNGPAKHCQDNQKQRKPNAAAVFI